MAVADLAQGRVRELDVRLTPLLPLLILNAYHDTILGTTPFVFVGIGWLVHRHSVELLFNSLVVGGTLDAVFTAHILRIDRKASDDD